MMMTTAISAPTAHWSLNHFLCKIQWPDDIWATGRPMASSFLASKMSLTLFPTFSLTVDRVDDTARESAASAR
jgi:hypothetical protein